MKKPFVDYRKAKEIEERYPTPFYLYDEKGIRETVRKLYKAFSWNKGYGLFFGAGTQSRGSLRIFRRGDYDFFERYTGSGVFIL